MKPFFQPAPVLAHPYESDDLLSFYLQQRFSSEAFAEIDSDLRRFGARVCDDIEPLGLEAEAQPPVHKPFDAWGVRVDEIKTSNAWKELHRISAEEGLVSIAYERKHGAQSRIFQFAKLYLFHPSSAFYSCPLAMTDGAARVLELHGSPLLKKQAFAHLTARDPKAFWTSGQWMTERTGGSDVSETQTLALPGSGDYLLSGDKWFTSATTSEMALVLAQTRKGDVARSQLSLFYVKLRDDSGRLQGIEISRLKAKLGTHALPTAELSLKGARAELIGAMGEGVKTVSSLLNITRAHNSVCALATMKRTLDLAQDYSSKRFSFGKRLIEHPLHEETLFRLRVSFEAMFHLVFSLVELLGKEETGKASAEESACLRALTPVAKLLVAKTAIAHVSEALEAFGGAGYVENVGLAKFARDAQVFSIWEGTTNILSLDLARALSKPGVAQAVFGAIEKRLAETTSAELAASVARIRELLDSVKAFRDAQMQSPRGEAGARDFAIALGRVVCASLLVEFAQRGFKALGENQGQNQGLPPRQSQRPKLSLAIARKFCATELSRLAVFENFEKPTDF